jgi:hypothetical protein
MLSSGGTLSDAEISRRLPRLTAITLDITLVRHGRFASWGVSRWLFDDVLAVTEQGSPLAIDVGPDGRRQQ